MCLKPFFLTPLLIATVTGCTTIKSYEPNTKPGPARANDYPIFIFPEKISPPRPYELIGTMSIRDTPVTIFGGSLQGELDVLRTKARAVGADAVWLTSVREPDFLHSKYRMEARLIRFSDTWESVPLTEAEFNNYLQTNRATLNPIEGLWRTTDATTHRIGIMRNNAKPGRDLIAFVLAGTDPRWRPGDKKIDLTSDERPGVYRGYYYVDNFQRQAVAFNLRGAGLNTFFFKLSEDSMPVIFTKE